MSVGNHTIVNMVFCAYCGKSFTRKEHLERHIPSHTNVKPHRCTNCQLSFARRDLLQRHYATYHEIRDPSLPQPASIPTVAGRSPIACLNCASAKTGCDKRVPCSRCTDKSLPCAARFARRSSKLIARAVAASEASAQILQATQQTDTVKVEQHPAAAKTTEATIDPRFQSPKLQVFSTDGFPEPVQPRFDAFDEFIHFNGELASPGLTYQDLLSWNDFPLDTELYGDAALAVDNLHPIYSEEGTTSSSSVSGSISADARPSLPQTRRGSRGSIDDLELEINRPSKRRKLSPRDAVQEFEEILEAELAWPLARCNPPTFSNSCPRTAVVHLESLEKNSKHEHGWESLDIEDDEVTGALESVKVESISLSTRDTLHAITQGFLHRALKTHRGGFATKGQNIGYSSPGNFSFLLLPPTRVLKYFLRSYARSLSTYYSLSAGGIIDPNVLLHGNQASALLVLLMIAQGATMAGSAEAKSLSAGLTETCRISLFDIIERDIELCADPIVLRCALLFTMLGAWSGDKWHMDIVMGQRGMYLAMLKHAGMLESTDITLPKSDSSECLEEQWASWIQAETRTRLVYNWVLVDQELALFHDLGTILSISELQAPLPHPDIEVFHASNANAWSSRLLSPTCQLQLPTSLHDLFQDFLHDNFSQPSVMTPITLRLLLHPIQSLLYQVRQVLTCFPDVLSTRRSTSRSLTKASTLTRLEEVQSLLQKWYTIHSALPPSPPGSLDSLSKTTNLILYHLISQNAHTCFPTLEKLARRAPTTLATPNPYWDLSLQHKKSIHHSSSALFHSGQILRLITSLAPSTPSAPPHDSSSAMGASPQPDRRPPWAPVAVYRATLVIWADVLAKSDPAFPQTPSVGIVVPINGLMPEDPTLMAWLWRGEGSPVLCGRDGGATALVRAEEVLEVCIGFVGGAEAVNEKGKGIGGGRLADGVVRKLRALKGNWHGPGGLVTL